MSRIKVLPHPDACPQGVEFDAVIGMSVCDNLLKNGVDIEHACEKVCACTTCHVLVRQGYDALNPPEEKEEDMLDRAWGLEAQSRLSCQARVTQSDLVIEIPKYSINHAKE